MIEAAAFLTAALSLGFGGWIIKGWLIGKIAKKSNGTSLWISALVQGVGWSLYLAVLAFALGTVLSEGYPKLATYLEKAALFFFLWQVGRWGERLAELGQNLSIRRSADPGGRSTISLLFLIGRICLWGTIGLLLLSNLGVNISALIAGLGVGSLAVALAVQNILGDLFASLSIMLDKPFVVGDSITVDKDSGTVEHIGWKTTRIRSVSGEEIVFSNSDLLKSRIRNFRRMSIRRASITFTLTFESSRESLQRLDSICGGAVEQTGAKFERIRFVGFSSLGMEYEISYWVESSEFSALAEAQTKLALLLKDSFLQSQLSFAYPTQRNAP
jgi:small-conductance mechanosensitive channel